MDLHAVRVIAGYELTLNIRNRWIQAFALVFAVLTLAIAYFGMVTSALVGFQSFTRTSASLVNLVLYLVPLAALTLATQSFQVEHGMDLLVAQPVRRGEILVGKVLGLFISMASASFCGFGAAGFIVAANVGGEGVLRYLAFVGYTLLLEIVFIAMGALISVAAQSRVRAVAFAICFWFFFVIFYDLAVIALAFVFRQHIANLLIFASLFGNPVDLARVSSLISLGSPTIFGAAGSALLKWSGGVRMTLSLLTGTLLLWILVLGILSSWLLKRRDL